MTRLLRTFTLWIAALLWLSGSVWMVLHYFFQTHTEFGLGPNAWQPTVIRVHGVLAVATVYLLGWISSRHVAETWRQRRKRVSGIALLSASGLLVLSGYALYYLVDDGLRNGASWIHQGLGVAVLALALAHWYRMGKRRNAQS